MKTETHTTETPAEFKPYSTAIPLTTKVKKFLEHLNMLITNDGYTEDQKHDYRIVKSIADTWFSEEVTAIKNNQI